MKRSIILMVFVLLLPMLPDAQYIFTNLQKKDGVSSNEVYCSYKDGEGFMWFGTANGLNRYDGTGFKNFNLSNTGTSLAGDMIVSCIAGDSHNKIWTGTTRGLFLFDKTTRSFTPIQFIAAGKPIENSAISTVFYDHLKRLWVATLKGLYVVTNNQAVEVSKTFASAKAFSEKVLTGAGIKPDSLQNGLWVSTMKGLYFLNFKTGATWSYFNNPEHLSVFDTSLIYSLATGTNGDTWISSAARPLYRYRLSDNSIVENKNPTIGLQYGIYIDYKNRLWLQNYSGMIQVVETDGTVTILPKASPENYKPSNSFFNSLFEDNEHNIWLAGANGISKLSPDNYIENIAILPGNLLTNTKVDYQINEICDAGNGNLWMCKDDGLYFFDSKTKETKRYAVPADNFKANRFFDIKLINGEWWCGTGNGIQILNPKTKQFRSIDLFAEGHDLQKNSCVWICQDKAGMVWFSSWYDAVYRYNPITKQTVQVKEVRSTEAGNAALTGSVCAFENTDGSMWLGNGEKGVMIYERKTDSYKPANLHGDIVVNSICRDDNNNIWLATTGRGILKTDSNGNLLDSITVNNGLSLSRIFKIFFDKTGRLWCSSNEGIQFIHTATKTISKLNLDMGLPVHDANGAMFLLNDKLYASTINKVATINIESINKLTSPVSPLISAIRVFEKDIPYASSNPALQLNYNQNFFSIEFSVLTHKEISSLQYAYRLKGFDKDWVYCGRRQIAAYTNVPNGDYTFSVKCTDANGHWIEKETTIHIIINPPFWKTWWFIGLLFLLAVFAAWRIYLAGIRQKQKNYIDKTIDYFANSVYGQNSVNEICWDIARNCISQLHFEDCVVYLLDEQKNVLVQKAAFGPKNPKGHEIDNPMEIPNGKGIVGTVAATGKPLLIKDTSKDDRYIVDDERRLSEITVPILHDGKVIGVIDSEHHLKNYFTEDHLKALSTIASISSNKIAEAKAEAMARENEIKLLEINKLLAESQLMALRAQMNPHFVFNCLNSIQECIVTQKYGEASNYLNKFSKLFRMVLNNSGQDLVTIDSEREVLELYLALEAMRFEKSFLYNFDVDEELETDEILVPSMLLQPYVENALWHGLMHKTGERRLTISFRRINEDVFECVIDDNGIGRGKALEIKEQQSKTKLHESKGMKISKDRLDLLQLQGNHASISIIDKYDESGNATGTRVVIQLSTFLKPH